MWATHCARCQKSLKGISHSMSFFNTDICCLDCLEEEKKHPRYQEAKEAELEAVRRGDYNFPGIGL